MSRTTYYRRDPKKGAKKKGATVEVAAELIGVPAEMLPVTENAAEALKDAEGRPIVACVVVRGDENGTD